MSDPAETGVAKKSTPTPEKPKLGQVERAALTERLTQALTTVRKIYEELPPEDAVTREQIDAWHATQNKRAEPYKREVEQIQERFEQG